MNSSTPNTRVRGQRLKRHERRDAKRLWLEHYIRHPDSPEPNVGLSCRAAGVSRSAFYQWLQTDELFAKKYDGVTTAFWPSHRAYFVKEYLKERDLASYGRELIRYDQRKQACKIDK